jgi:hypothetical protein
LTEIALMAVSFAAMAGVRGIEKLAVPFLIIYGASYFFTEFGPHATTFVYPAEQFPVEARTTGHGIFEVLCTETTPLKTKRFSFAEVTAIKGCYAAAANTAVLCY